MDEYLVEYINFKCPLRRHKSYHRLSSAPLIRNWYRSKEINRTKHLARASNHRDHKISIYYLDSVIRSLYSTSLLISTVASSLNFNAISLVLPSTADIGIFMNRSRK